MFLATLLIDRLIRGIFTGERKVRPWHSRPLPIPRRQFVKSEQQLLHHKPSKIASAPHEAIVRTAKKVILQLYTKLGVNTTTPVLDLFILTRVNAAQSTTFLSSRCTWSNWHIQGMLVWYLIQQLWIENAPASEMNSSSVFCQSTHSNRRLSSWKS